MFPSHSPEQAAVASQLLGELDRYDKGLRVLLERRWDPVLYRDLSDRFDRMQMFAQALPRIAADWTELVISRVELTQALWAVREKNPVSSSALSAHARHEEIIREIRQRCGRYLSDDPRP